MPEFENPRAAPLARGIAPEGGICSPVSRAELAHDAHGFVLSCVALAFAILAWDAAALDLPLERLFAGADGFALHDAWWLKRVLHDDAQRLGLALLFVLVLMIRWPLGFLRELTRAERIGLVLGCVVAALVIQWLKRISVTSCPWDLTEFGGAAHYVSHWRWQVRDGGPGHCFPAGHASTGFAFMPAWFWLRRRVPRAARIWLAASVTVGFALGFVQMLRGAHYFSHLLWAGWLAFAAGGAFWIAARFAACLRLRHVPGTRQ